MDTDSKALIEEGLRRLDLPADPRRVESLFRYASEIERWNRRINLVRAEGELLIKRHLLDSLAGLSVIDGIEDRDAIADIGSGAGLPGSAGSIFLLTIFLILLWQVLFSY